MVRFGDGGGFPVGMLLPLLVLLALPVRLRDDSEVRDAVRSKFPVLRLTTLITVPALDGRLLEVEELWDRSTRELRNDGGAEVGIFDVDGEVYDISPLGP